MDSSPVETILTSFLHWQLYLLDLATRFSPFSMLQTLFPGSLLTALPR